MFGWPRTIATRPYSPRARGSFGLMCVPPSGPGSPASGDPVLRIGTLAKGHACPAPAGVPADRQIAIVLAGLQTHECPLIRGEVGREHRLLVRHAVLGPRRRDHDFLARAGERSHRRFDLPARGFERPGPGRADMGDRRVPRRRGSSGQRAQGDHRLDDLVGHTRVLELDEPVGARVELPRGGADLLDDDAFRETGLDHADHTVIGQDVLGAAAGPRQGAREHGEEADHDDEQDPDEARTA